MNIRLIGTFVGGLVVGGATGVLGTMKYFQNKYQKRYEEDHAALEEYYDRVDEYARKDQLKEVQNNEVCATCEHYDKGQNKCMWSGNLIKKPYTSYCIHYEKPLDSPVETNSRPGGRMTPEERAAVKEKLNRNWKGTTDYAGMYKRDDQNDSAESQHPLDQGEPGEAAPEDLEPICTNCEHYTFDEKGMGYCELIEEHVNQDDSCSDWRNEAVDETTPEEEVFNEHQKNKNKPPRIISEEAYSNLPAHIDKQVLYFYAYDEVLVDEDDEDTPIDEPGLLIGDALTKYNFIESDERIIFVMNYAQDTCYEVQKVDASWNDTH